MSATLLTTDSAELLRKSILLANRYAVAALEEEPARVIVDGLPWIDTRPMVDPRERSPELVDMATEVLDYALSAGLAARHPQQPHLVRVTLQPYALATI